MNDATTVPTAELSHPRFQKHFSEFIGIGENGHLWVEGCDCVDLAKKFGTPLYVLSEHQFRHNYRRFRDAFEVRYPDVQVLFANKSNRGPAYRHIMNQEGAGGDCFGLIEMYLALQAGTDPSKLVLNGSNKEPEEIEMAIRNGVCINIDALDELDIIAEKQEQLGNPLVTVGIRVKLELKPLETRHGVVMHGPGSLAQQARAHKWGMTIEQTIGLVRRIQSMGNFHLEELHYHLSRMDNKVEDFAVMVREMVQWSARLRDETGYVMPALDIGGGFAFGRPEKTGPYGADDENTPSFEAYADAICGAIRDECGKVGLPLPKLKIEPGWAIAGSAGIAIGRVGAVKEWPGYKRWVNLDLSGNHIPPPWYHHILSVNKAGLAGEAVVDIVGPLCSSDELGRDRNLPLLGRGDLVALLDIGGYAESHAKNSNAQLRPATVLVSGAHADITTERERLSDVIGRFRVPAHILAGSFSRQARDSNLMRPRPLDRSSEF